jgi:hypothetical protein
VAAKDLALSLSGRRVLAPKGKAFAGGMSGGAALLSGSSAENDGFRS